MLEDHSASAQRRDRGVNVGHTPTQDRVARLLRVWYQRDAQRRAVAIEDERRRILLDGPQTERVDVELASAIEVTDADERDEVTRRQQVGHRARRSASACANASSMPGGSRSDEPSKCQTARSRLKKSPA